jgi:hypothetical protein
MLPEVSGKNVPILPYFFRFLEVFENLESKNYLFSNKNGLIFSKIVSNKHILLYIIILQEKNCKNIGIEAKIGEIFFLKFQWDYRPSSSFANKLVFLNLEK